MKKSKLAASIVDKIKDEKIEQHSKLYFFAKFLLILIGGIIFFLIGLIASAVIWHFFHDAELLEIFSIERALFVKALFLSFPIFWLLFAVSIGFVASFFAKNTKKGYKKSYKKWFILIIVVQILGGLALEQSPLGRHLEHSMMRKIRIGKSRENSFQKIWQNPEKGLLIGEILEIEKGEIVLSDLDENKWKVLFKKEDIRNRGPLKEFGKIRIIGEKTGESEFSARKIMGLRFNFSRPPRPNESDRVREKIRPKVREKRPRF